MGLERPSWVDAVVAEQVSSMPPYVPGKPVAELERELGIRNAIKMASNENPLGPSPRALQSLEKHFRSVHVYPESSAPDLRSALAVRWGLEPDSVILGNGSDEIMGFAAHVFVRPGDEVLISENTFSMYRICGQAFGGIVRTVPLKRYCHDLGAMSRLVGPKTRLIFLPIPNSPTGTVVSREDFESFLKDLPREGLVLVMDEAYREYVSASDCPNGIDYIGCGLPVLVLRTFSKIYGLAGLRVGYGLSEPWLVELLNRVRPPFNVNSLAQAAALEALDDSDHVKRSLEVTRRGMEYLQAELTGLGLEVIPSQANFIAFSVPNGAGKVYEALLREGVIVRYLASFGMDRHIRVTIGDEAQNRLFVAALKKVLPH